MNRFFYTLLGAVMLLSFAGKDTHIPILLCFEDDCDPVRDSLILIQLKNASGNPFWDSGQPMSTWAGVTLNESGCVKALVLQNKRVNSPLTSIAELTQLEVLDLRNGRIGGKMPAEIGDLRQLKKLNLNGNELVGAIPNSIGNLDSLAELDLSSNQLNFLPPEIGNLKHLEQLNLRGNILSSSSIPKKIDGCQRLKNLNISYNKLASLPTEINNLKELKVLDLSHNNFNENLLPPLHQLTKLQKLSLVENLFTTIPSTIGQLKYLDTLFIDNNKLKSASSSTQLMESLKVLSLSNNSFTQIPISITRLDSLETLNLSYNPLGEIRPEIGQLISLKNLFIHDTKLKELPSEMFNLVNLEYLKISKNDLTVLGNGIGFLSKLKLLYLNDTDLKQVPSSIGNLKQLQFLDLSATKIDSLPDELGNLSNLITLELSSTQLPKIPVCIGRLSLLDSLRLSQNTKVVGLPVQIGALSNLKFLSLSSTPLKELPASFRNLNKLEHLDLNFTKLTFFPEVITALGSLRRLSMNGTGMTGGIPEAINKLDLLTFLDLRKNNLSQLPIVNNGLKNDALYIGDNYFTFEDILPNMKHYPNGDSQTNKYAYQKAIFPDTSFTVLPCQNTVIDLRIDSSMSDNFYTWYKDGKNITQLSVNKLDLQDLYDNPSDYAGTYTCEVTNVGVPHLVLKTGKITVKPFPKTGLCEPYYVNIDSTLCYHDFIKVGGVIFDRSNPKGCQMVQEDRCSTLYIINLDFHQADTTYFTRDICPGQQVYISNQRFDCTNPSGFVQVNSVVTGCDSIIAVQLECKTCDTEVVEIPTAFTPNQDGYNDTFEIPNRTESGHSYSNIHLRIFNRSRQLVFEQVNYRNGWDGRDLQGNSLPAGTYFYTIQYEDGDLKTGTITIIR